MINITFTLSNENAQRLLDAFGASYEDEVANPEGLSKAAFAREKLAQYIRQEVIRREKEKARQEVAEPSAITITVT